MSLLSRLIQPDQTTDPPEVKISIHTFMAAIAEYKRNPWSRTRTQRRADLVAAFNLNTAEANSLDEFFNNQDANNVSREEIHDVLFLGEGGYYTIAQTRTRLIIT